MPGRKKDFQQRDGECSYCEFQGNIIVFESPTGEEVEICGGCVGEALDEFDGEDLSLRGV